MSQLVVAPLLVALVTAVLTLLVRSFPRVQRGVSLLGGVGYAVAVAGLWTEVAPLGPARTVVYQLSNWRAPWGITLVADPLSAFMLAFSAVLSLAALAFSVQYVDEFGQKLSYHPLYHFMMVGVTGSFLTGDIFNLFVWFEVMLMSSYVLVVFYSGPQHTRAALQYVVLNLVGSAVMLLAIGGIYATVGTLNMADLARRLANPAQFGIESTLPVLGLSALLFAVFALKAGLAPFQFWVPAAYRAAPAPVSAMLAGVVKKVGIYGIVRLYFTVFSGLGLSELALPGFAGDSLLAFFGPILFAMAAASILLGGVGAIGREDIDGLLAYSSIGQVGFIVLPLAIAATASSEAVRTLGVAAALVYALNHALAKGLLFLTSGSVYSATGTIRFSDLGGMTREKPVLSGVFFVGALSLIGIPPLSGFFGKFLVFRAAGNASAWAALGLALVGAILTIAYFSRAWNRGFWGPVSPMVGESGPATGVAIGVALAVAVVVVGVGFDPIWQAAQAAASAALDTDAYVHAVDPGSAGNASAGSSGGGH